MARSDDSNVAFELGERETQTPHEPRPDGQSAEQLSEKEERARRFRPRHLQMMALGIVKFFGIDFSGSSIATGLFFQTGKMLYFSGPVSMLLAFVLMGSVSYAVMVSNCVRIG